MSTTWPASPPCTWVVVLDWKGDYHTTKLGQHQDSLEAAKALVEQVGLNTRPKAVYHYTTVVAGYDLAAITNARSQSVSERHSFRLDEKVLATSKGGTKLIQYGKNLVRVVARSGVAGSRDIDPVERDVYVENPDLLDFVN